MQYDDDEEKRQMKNMIIHHLPDKNDQEEFGRWAFGEDYREQDSTLQFMTSWNFNHGEKLELHPSNAIDDDIPKMIEIWQKSKQTDLIRDQSSPSL